MLTIAQHSFNHTKRTKMCKIHEYDYWNRLQWKFMWLQFRWKSVALCFLVSSLTTLVNLCYHCDIIDIVDLCDFSVRFGYRMYFLDRLHSILPMNTMEKEVMMKSNKGVCVYKIEYLHFMNCGKKREISKSDVGWNRDNTYRQTGDEWIFQKSKQR